MLSFGGGDVVLTFQSWKNVQLRKRRAPFFCSDWTDAWMATCEWRPGGPAVVAEQVMNGVTWGTENK